MKFWLIIFSLIFIPFSENATETQSSDGTFSEIQNPAMEIKGYPGSIIDKCIKKRIKSQDIDHLIEPFKIKNETRCWQREF